MDGSKKTEGERDPSVGIEAVHPMPDPVGKGCRSRRG